MAVVVVKLAFDDNENAKDYIEQLTQGADPAAGHKGFLGRSVTLVPGHAEDED